MPLTFLRLTYDTGTMWNARFAPDGQNVVFAGGLERQAHSDVSCRARIASGVTPLSLPDASLFSMSATGELAVSLGHAFDGWMGEGTLARAPILAGAPRALIEHVREADWSPDGSDLAIVRRCRLDGAARVSGRARCSTRPPATSRTSASRATASASPLPIIRSTATTTATWRWSISRARRRRWSRGLQGLRGVAWSPDDREVWFTAGSDQPYSGVVLRASTLDGRLRTVLALPTDWRILDVAKDGRALMSSELVQRQIEVWRDDRRSRRT